MPCCGDLIPPSRQFHGEQGEPGEPGERGPRGHEFSWRQALTYLACFIAIGLSTLGWLHGDNKINDEGMQRRSATCTTFEAQHLDEVKKLRGTYRYLLTATPAERGSTLYKIVKASLPELQRNAASDQDTDGVFVPLYCDEPGVGLPEPDPQVPPVPAQLRPINRGHIPPLLP